MTYLGDFALGDTLDFKFTTRQATGTPFTLAGTPSVAAYPGNSTTEVTAGITLSVDFDSRTGCNNVRVVATSGNGYATATNYAIVITAGTVNGVSVVGETVAHFSIENRSGLRPTTAGRTLDVSAGGEAGVDWANVGSPTTALDLSATTIKTSQVVGSVSGAVGSVTGNVGGNVVGSVASVTAGVTVTTNNDKTGYGLSASYDFAKGTVAMAEAYAANGVAPTPIQGLYAIHQMLQQFAISTTNYTVKKLDNTTTAFVVTLDSATTPTSAART